jgi:predicted RNase H-like HicB family nuclease
MKVRRERTAMVDILIHAEEVSGSELSWWAEAPDVPGFSAAANRLVELRQLVSQSLGEIAEDRGETRDSVEIRYTMLPPEPASEGPSVDRTDGVPTSVTSGPSVVGYAAVA